MSVFSSFMSQNLLPCRVPLSDVLLQKEVLHQYPKLPSRTIPKSRQPPVVKSATSKSAGPPIKTTMFMDPALTHIQKRSSSKRVTSQAPCCQRPSKAHPISCKGVAEGIVEVQPDEAQEALAQPREGGCAVSRKLWGRGLMIPWCSTKRMRQIFLFCWIFGSINLWQPENDFQMHCVTQGFKKM